MFDFFRKKIIGLDIADHTMEIIELEQKGKDVVIHGKARKPLPAGLVQRGKIQNHAELAKTVRDACQQAVPHPIQFANKLLVCGLPESQVFTHIFQVKKNAIKMSELKNKVEEEVHKTIPIDSNNVLFSYRVSREDKETSEILVVATYRDTREEWNKFLKLLTSSQVILDIEILACGRAHFFSKQENKKSVLLVDMGVATTNIAFFDVDGVPRYTTSLDYAGASLTQTVATALGISLDEAEQKKISHGLETDDQKLKESLISGLEPITREINIVKNYLKEQFGISANEIIVIGGTSQLKGLRNYCSEQLNLPVNFTTLTLRGLDAEEPALYFEAFGLALRGLSQKAGDKEVSF